MSNNKEKIAASFATIFWKFYLAIGVVQFICLYAYVTERWFDIPIISFIASIVMAYIPVVGAVLGYIGATEIFQWNIVVSVILFFGSYTLFLLVGLFFYSKKR